MKVYADLPAAEDFIAKIIPNFWSFLVQFLALIVLGVVVIFVAYKPVKKMLKKRQDYIENNIREAEENRANAIIKEREARELVLASKKEANLILENATKEAEVIRINKLNETEDEIESMKLRAEKDIERAKEEAKDEIKKEMINIALDASSVILKREVNSDDNTRLVEEFIKDIE